MLGDDSCDVCHESSFILEIIAADGVCDTCHSPDGAFDGVNDATIGAGIRVNWEEGVYEEDGKTLKAGKEQWCAGCHDDVPALSRQPSTIAPIIVDNSDAGASWTGSWPTSSWAPGYYGADYAYHLPGAGPDTFRWTPTITTPGDYSVYARWTQDPSRAPDTTYTIYHDGGSTPVVVNQRGNGGTWVLLGTFAFDGTADYVEMAQNPNGYVVADAVKWEAGGPSTLAPNVIGDDVSFGYYVTGHKVDCLSCHDAGKMHIDHEHRTYQAGTTGHGDSYRLRNINGQPAMNIPRPLYSPGTNPLTYADDFALCFDCHNKSEVLTPDKKPGKTNFWNNDTSPQNSHNIHLGIYTNHFDSDWNGAADSSESCTTCHNVHGSATNPMIRYGELISTPGTANKVPALNFSYLDPPPPGIRNPNTDLASSIGGNMLLAGPGIAQNGVCNACHWGLSYLRTPNLGPRVLTPAAEPETIDIGAGAVDILLTVFVLDHDNNVTGVTVDLTSVGGSSTQTMYDDGTNGDGTAGDRTYSYLATIPDTIDPGTKSLTVTATDPGNFGTNMIRMTVTLPGVIIVDNTDVAAVAVGAWGTSSYAPGYYGTNYHYHTPGAGPDTFTWTPTIDMAGFYEVFARWTEDPSRAPNATYTIHHDGGISPVPVDQRSNGGVWVSLGFFNFDGLNNDRVVLIQNASGYVIADAVRLELQP
jgi:hypothetical protein